MIGAITTERREGTLHAANDCVEVDFDLEHGSVTFADGIAIKCRPAAAGLPVHGETLEVALDTPVLVRVVSRGFLGDLASFRITYELFQTRNLHIYVRLEAEQAVELGGLELPRIDLAGASLRDLDNGPLDLDGRWGALVGDKASVGFVVKKLPWKARWNDVGCFSHGVLGGTRAIWSSDGPVLALAVPGKVALAASDTVEAGLFLRRFEETPDEVRAEATHDHPDEGRYIPEGEYAQTLLWETERVWLGPPIFDGCPRRPYDQLIPRPLGLDVLARKRFTWNNEDFSLWHLTGKDRYWESGIKKAYALVETQNSHGGWYEGIEFYNLPPEHHHMYDTYISGLFLLEAYDLTGHDRFLEAAQECKRFWLGPPPANGHTVEAPDAWWYRWGGYVNDFGYTDERRVLNTHAGATEFLALLYERTGDDEARQAAEHGINAFKWGLERGIQKENGQFLYCLSQIDPTLERPGDPPYLRLDLVPQIEDVYTVASSYRLMMANRVLGDPAVTQAVRRALDYWWAGYREGRVYTYRAYAVLAYALAAGEINPVYALALPELLRDREHFTSMQRGFSSFIAPAGLPALTVEVEAFGSSFVEPIFLRRRKDEFLFALVNLEYPRHDIGVSVELPVATVPTGATRVDPADGQRSTLDVTCKDGRARFIVPTLGEFGVTLIELKLTADS